MRSKLFKITFKVGSKIIYSQKYFKERDYLNPLLAESIKILARENNLKTILDVGCGTGRLVHFLNENGFQAYGCDSAKAALISAKKLNRKQTIKKTLASKLPYKNHSFDLVTAISVIEHLTEKEAQKIFSEVNRVLKSEGLIFLVTPNFSSPFRLLFGEKWFAFSDPTHRNFFTPKSIASLLKNHGFQNIRFRFKSAYNIPFAWYLPKLLNKLPKSLNIVLNYLLISSPLSTFRDSIWVVAQK